MSFQLLLIMLTCSAVFSEHESPTGLRACRVEISHLAERAAVLVVGTSEDAVGGYVVEAAPASVGLATATERYDSSPHHAPGVGNTRLNSGKGGRDLLAQSRSSPIPPPRT